MHAKEDAQDAIGMGSFSILGEAPRMRDKAKKQTQRLFECLARVRALASPGSRLALPLGLILEVGNYLSNRTVRLRVTGTFDQPVVQVNVTQLLSEQAVRYFLAPYLVGSGVAAGAYTSSASRKNQEAVEKGKACSPSSSPCWPSW